MGVLSSHLSSVSKVDVFFSFGLCFKVSNCLPLDGIKGKALSHHIWTVKQIHKLGFKIYRLAI